MNAAGAFDAIVVGSGAGGAAATWQMVQGGLRVLLLERGGRLPQDGSTLDVERVVRRGEFLAREPWVDGRGRVFAPEEHFNVGGKTKWYGAALLRFSAAEFAADAVHGCRGWPFALAELAPWYEQAEALLGVREIPAEPGLARIVANLVRPGSGWAAAALPMALAPGISRFHEEAAHFDGFASARNLKGEAECSLLAPLATHPGLVLVGGAEVTALLGVPGTPERISGVRLADGRECHAPQVVLAAGALHSPRLLARYLDSSGLAATLPSAASVGRNLKYHLLTAMVAIGARRQDDLLRKTRLLVHRDFAHSSAQPLGFDGELIATLMPRWLPGPLRRALGQRAYGFFLQTEDGSDPRNRVYERQRDGQLERVLDYDAGRLATAVREHARFNEALRGALLRAGLLAFGQRIGLAGTAHVCGTLACGVDERDSVVAADGHVLGLEGLHVADGSILPRISRVNPSLTIYAWGLRLGARLAGLGRPAFTNEGPA